MNRPLISVIVLNHNGRRWLGPCLDALAAQVHAPPSELLVFDNASTDGSMMLVAERYPQVKVVQSTRNLGFAAGNNTAARAARGSVLAFLNNDTVVAPDWLTRLHAALASRPDVGVAASRIVFLDNPDMIDSAGDGYLRVGGAFKHGYGAPAREFSQAGEVFGACGAAFMIKRDVFDSLGGFDERFFMVYEDVDLSYRARLAGYRCWYAADAVVRHAGSATLGRLSASAVFYGQRNLEWTWIKNTPASLLLRTAPGHILYSAAGVVHYLRVGKGGPALRGKLAALFGLPAVLRARLAVQRRRRIAVRDLAALMDTAWVGRKRREKSVGLDLSDHEQRRIG